MLVDVARRCPLSRLGRAMLFMLVDTPDPRYGGFYPHPERGREFGGVPLRKTPPAPQSPAFRRRRRRVTVPHARDRASAAGGGRPCAGGCFLRGAPVEESWPSSSALVPTIRPARPRAPHRPMMVP